MCNSSTPSFQNFLLDQSKSAKTNDSPITIGLTTNNIDTFLLKSLKTNNQSSNEKENLNQRLQDLEKAILNLEKKCQLGIEESLILMKTVVEKLDTIQNRILVLERNTEEQYLNVNDKGK